MICKKLMRHRHGYTVGILVVCLSNATCTTSSVELSTGQLPSGDSLIERGEAVTILFTADFSLTAVPVDAGAVESCITTAIEKQQPKIPIVPAGEFIRVAFPDLPSGGAPTDVKYLSVVLPHPLFRERIAPLNLRYLIAVSGGTESDRSGGTISGAAPRAFAIIGGYVWDRKSIFRATIIDLRSAQPAAQAQSASGGRAWLFFIMPSPIVVGAPAFTETRACAELGAAIGSFLAGAERPDAQEVAP